jgi:hypothetical protein
MQNLVLTPSPKRAPWWDLVGMALSGDKRIVVILPCMYLAAWGLSLAPSITSGMEAVSTALGAELSMLLHWAEIALAWI